MENVPRMSSPSRSVAGGRYQEGLSVHQGKCLHSTFTQDGNEGLNSQAVGGGCHPSGWFGLFMVLEES